MGTQGEERSWGKNWVSRPKPSKQPSLFFRLNWNECNPGLESILHKCKCYPRKLNFKKKNTDWRMLAIPASAISSHLQSFSYVTEDSSTKRQLSSFSGSLVRLNTEFLRSEICTFCSIKNCYFSSPVSKTEKVLNVLSIPPSPNQLAESQSGCEGQLPTATRSTLSSSHASLVFPRDTFSYDNE